MTPIKAIRAHCLDCCCGSVTEVRRCPCQTCFLWPYRLGHRPKTENIPTAENGLVGGIFSADEAGDINTPGNAGTSGSSEFNRDYEAQDEKNER